MRAILPFFAAAVLCAQEDQPLFKAGANIVRVDIQVEEYGQILRGLSGSDFIIFDENRQQTITHFAHDIEPLSLILLLDISGSMTKSIDAVSRASRQALANLRPGDKVAVMLFARSSKVTQDFTSDFEAVSRQIGSAVGDKTLGSATLLNHAIVAAANHFEDTAPVGRRAILIVTDNLGLNYELNDEQVLKKLHSANAVMNAIVTGRAKRPEADTKARYTNPDFSPSNVFLLSDETGGEAFRPERVDAALGSIFEKIRRRYALEYSAPPDGKPGAYHHIRVTLSPLGERKYPKAQLRARKGYYAAE